MRIKNWGEYQHFKDRNPPWIKLYRHLLNDMEWHQLDMQSSKILVMLWLLAAESKDGSLPSLDIIVFRLRLPKSAIESTIPKLSHWLIFDDIELISGCHQGDAPEKRRDRDRDREEKRKSFEEFWSMYPRKTGKGKAEDSWNKIGATNGLIEKILASVKSHMLYPEWQKDNGQFIPNPATWLNQKRWEDEPMVIEKPKPKLVL